MSSKLTGTELVSLLSIKDDVLVYAERRFRGDYQVGDPVPLVDHNGRPYYQIGPHLYRPDRLIKAVQADDPAIWDAAQPSRPNTPELVAAGANRDMQIAAMLQQGMTYADVGARFGLTRQRVKQIQQRLESAGIPCNPKQARAELREVAVEQFNQSQYGGKYGELQALPPELLKYLKKRLTLKRNHANQRGIEFSLTLSDLLPIPTVCPVLGIPIIIGADDTPKGPHDNALSFDRIDSSKGYVPGNVLLISQRANRIKNDSTPAELSKLAEFYNALTARLTT